MARRNQRRGDYLMTSDYSGCTEYASRLVKDYWGSYGLPTEVLTRNLQEIATPLEDPYPVKVYRGPEYEFTDACTFEQQPTYIGNTLVPFPDTQLTQILNLHPSIPNMSVGCTLIVQPDTPFPVGFITTGDDVPITTGDGQFLVI